MMDAQAIRVMVVDADPGGGHALQDILENVEGIEVEVITRNKRMAISEVQAAHPEVLLVDLILPGYRSIEVIQHVSDTLPETHILALSPGDPDRDRIILALHAGALGFITRDTDPVDISAALQAVHQGDRWLPLEETYEVLQEAAPELEVSEKQTRDRLTQLILGIIPLTGFIAAITAFLWREYWGSVGVRVVDLGVDPTTRLTDVLVFFLRMLGIFGPLLLVETWRGEIAAWISHRSGLTKIYNRAYNFHLGKLSIGKFLFSHWVGWFGLALIVLSIAFLLNQFVELILIMVVGPMIGVVLLANFLGLDDNLPVFLKLPRERNGLILVIMGVLILLFLGVLGGEVFVRGPDLRTDGVHGILVTKVLDVSARPVMLYDLDEKQEPLGALYLGGNADLYVLYDPCEEAVRLVPVGSSRVEVIDQVICPP